MNQEINMTSIEEHNNDGTIILTNNYQDSIINYSKIIVMDPTDDLAWFNRGITKLKIQDFSGAIVDLSKSLELYSEDANAYYFRSVAKYNQEDFPGAVSDILKAIELDPRLKANNRDKDPIYEGINNYIKTIIQYKKAIEYNLWDTDAYQERARLKELARDFYGAITDYTKIIGMDSCNVGAYFKRGYIKDFHLKDHIGALEDFDSALKIVPEAAEIYLHRADTKQSLNDLEGAISDYSKIIELFDLEDPEEKEDPDFYYEMAYYGRGYIKEKLNDYQGAIDDYSAAIKLNAYSFFGYSGRGSAKIEIRDYIGAITDCTKAIKIDRRDARAYNFRGKAKIEVKDYKGAISDLNKAIKLNPTLTELYFNRGVAKIKSGKKKTGDLDLAKAGELGYEIAGKQQESNSNNLGY